MTEIGLVDKELEVVEIEDESVEDSVEGNELSLEKEEERGLNVFETFVVKVSGEIGNDLTLILLINLEIFFEEFPPLSVSKDLLKQLEERGEELCQEAQVER